MFIDLWTLVQWIHDGFLLLLILGAIYLFGLTLAALWLEWNMTNRDVIESHNQKPLHHFLVLVPAHNEERSILSTLQSLKRLNYPKDRIQIVVISDNSDDATSDISRAAGAKVLERTDPHHRGKGFALRFGFSEMLNDPDWDACVVIDADSELEPQTLRVLNGYLHQKGDVFQLNDQIVPRADSWSSEITRLGFFLYNYIRPMGKRALGFPVGLRGNGMCFRRSVIQTYPWQAFSLAEDLEFGLYLITNGVDPIFVPEATVLAKMPTHAEDAVSQRRRWEMGRWPLFRVYTGKLLVRRGIRSVETLIDLFIPPLVHFVGLIGVGWVLWIIAEWGMGMNLSRFSFSGWGWLITGSLLLGHVGLSLRSNRADAGLRRALLFAPKYILWKARVYLMTVFKGREKVWVRTTRR